MLHKCHTYPTFGSNFAFPAQTDRCGPILSTIRTPPSRKTRGPTHMPNPHAAIRMPPSACRRPHAAVRMPPSTCRHPHAAVRMPPSACRRPHADIRTPPSARRRPHAAARTPPSAWNPHAATRTAACGFYAGFIRISCRFRAGFM